jgi:hypothetical protein
MQPHSITLRSSQTKLTGWRMLVRFIVRGKVVVFVNEGRTGRTEDWVKDRKG